MAAVAHLRIRAYLTHESSFLPQPALPGLQGSLEFALYKNQPQHCPYFLSKQRKTWLSFASLFKSKETYQVPTIGSESMSCLVAMAHLLLPTCQATEYGRDSRSQPGCCSRFVCSSLCLLGLQLIDPLLLKHPAIDPPRERKKKMGKKIN